MDVRSTCALLASLALFSCGDTGGGSNTGTDSASGTSIGSVTASTSVGSSGATTNATDSASGSSGGSSAGSTGTSTGTITGGPKFDLGEQPDVPGSCDEVCGNTDWSYIWISNSSEHTVTKLNTRTMVEEGRYLTRSDGSGSPSRTSVSVDGKAVVVANRYGGLTKYWTRPEFCEDKNNDNQITTSTGKNDVLLWDDEECIAWHTLYPGTTVQRPVAWTSGVWSPAECAFVDQKVWSTSGDGSNEGSCSGGFTTVLRLDGESGVVEDSKLLNDVTCSSFGPYGGAVDSDGNFWFAHLGGGGLIRVDFQTLDHVVHNGGFYGIMVDTEGRPWTDLPRRYNEMTQTWDDIVGVLPSNGGTGVAQDLQGRIWSGTSGGIGWVDMETMVVGDTVALPGGGLFRGIAVDVDGFIWAVPLSGTQAFKVHPDTYAVDSYDGLNGPYTYSDMTGGQLSNVTCNPPRG